MGTKNDMRRKYKFNENYSQNGQTTLQEIVDSGKNEHNNLKAIKLDHTSD